MALRGRLVLKLFVFICLIGVAVSCKEPQSSRVTPKVPNFGSQTQTVSFGSDKVFRIGDGLATDSSCSISLEQLGPAGTAFQFSFEVMEKASDVKIELLEICGVDLQNNLVSISRGSEVIAVEALEPLASSKKFEFKNLPVGVYAIRVESGFLFNGPDTALDDFILGKLEVTANGPVRAIGVPAALSEPLVTPDFYEKSEFVHYVLGDGFGGDTFCPAGQPNIEEIEGDFLDWELETFATTTSVIFNLFDICGMDYGFNFIELVDESEQIIFRQFFNPQLNRLLSPQRVLPAGRYRLRVQSQKDFGGSHLDDFRIKGFRIYSSHDLEILGPEE